MIPQGASVELIPNQGSVTGISTTSVKVLDSCPPDLVRIMWAINNISTTAQVISLGYGKDAVLSQGIVLASGIQIWESLDPAFAPFQGRLNAISSAVNGAVAFFERLVPRESLNKRW